MIPIVLAAVTGLDLWSDGRSLHLLLGAGDRIEHVRSADAGRTWSKPAALPAKPYRTETGDIQLAGEGERLLAVWTTAGPGPMKSGPLAAAVSSDGGRTWKPAPAPAAGAGVHGRRFVDVARAGGRWHAVWLDRQDNAELRYSSWDGKAKAWEPERTLDDDVCECCWNTLAAEGRTLTVLYRDRQPRDLTLLRSADGGKTWSQPSRPGGFGWAFNGCPHVGGGLTPGGDVLVWTGKEGEEGVYHVSAGGRKRRLGGDKSRFGDIAAGGGRLAAVWTEGRSVVGALSADGRSWSKPERLAEQGTHPRVVAAEGGFRVFWVEKDKGWKSAVLGM